MSRRLGRNKAVVLVGGEPLINRVMARVSQITGEVMLVVADLDRASDLLLPDSTNVVVDISPGKGSLGGIFSGLSAMEGEWGLTVACDMPFINLQLFAYMLDLRQGFDAVVPVINGHPEPMHALYSRRCLTPIGRQLQRDHLKIACFFNGVRVRFVLEEEVDKMDPEHLSFFNINTQRDLERALVLVSQGL